MRKFLFCIYVLLSLIWSLFYGVTTGCLGGVVSWYQHMICRIKESILNRKAYPVSTINKRINTHLKYSDNVGSTRYQIKKKSLEKTYSEKHSKIPHTFIDTLLIFIIHIPLIFILPIKGLFIGPYNTLDRCLAFWHKRFKIGG